MSGGIDPTELYTPSDPNALGNFSTGGVGQDMLPRVHGAGDGGASVSRRVPSGL